MKELFVLVKMRTWKRVSGAAWILSWFAIYLEIYRWHHMTPSLGLRPPDPRATPGEFLITVLICSVVAPLVFVALVIWERMAKKVV